MKTKMPKMLPKTIEEITNGGVYEQSVRCGKSNCRCSKGDLHKGLFYYLTRVNGKLRKTYVRNADVKEVTNLVEKAACDRLYKRKLTVSNRELMQRLRELLRERQLL